MTIGKNKLRFYIIDALVLGIFSAIAFLVPFEHTAQFWISYAFGVLAILLQVYAYPKAFEAPGAKSKIYGFPLARVATIYLLAQLVLSLGFMAAGIAVKTWVIWLIDLILLAFVLIGLITVNVVQEEVQRQETTMKKDVSALKAMKAKAASLVSAGMPDMKTALEALSEEFFSADPVSSEATKDLEAKLSVRLEDLSEAVDAGKTEEVISLCRKITALLKERNAVCKANK